MSSDRADLEDVRFAYRLLLGREPDASGLETYRRLVREQDLRPRELAAFFLGSSEFRQLGENDRREVHLDGFTLVVAANDNDVGKPVARLRQWEPHVISVLDERLQGAGGRFLDVGANIGYFTAWAAHRVGPSGRVVSIEPMDKNVQLIYATVLRNDFKHVRVEPFAASNENGIACMSTNDASSNGQIERAGSGGRSLYAQTRRLDDLLADERRFDVVKFDIEGHELNAWRGFSRTLERDRPVVLTEFHPRCLSRNAGVEPEEYGALLFQYGVVTVLHSDGKRSSCRDLDALMRLWAREDAALGTEGAAHLDLLVEPHS